jgi:hypothetical protein
MAAVGRARLVFLRELGGNQVLNLGIAPRLYGLWPRPLAAWVLNAAGR